MLNSLLDIFWLGKGIGLATRARDALLDVRSDVEFLAAVRRGVLPLPGDGYPEPVSPFRRAGPALLPDLAGRRVAISASGGSGAMASLVGVLRACEEAAVSPSVLAVCSGSALFGFPWAAGRSADEVAEFMLGLRPRDYVDPDWARLALLGPTLGRGFGGIVRGDALEASLVDWLGDQTLADLAVPCYAPAWNVADNRLVYLGPQTFPHVTVARAIRVSIALPLFFAPAEIDGAYWCDGGVVDVFPVSPLVTYAEPPDVALAVNCFWPPGLVAEQRPRWHQEAFSLLTIESQVRTANHLQHSKDNLTNLGRHCPVVITEPVPYDVIRGAGLYQQFVDTRQWPEFMREGLAAGRVALREAARLLA